MRNHNDLGKHVPDKTLITHVRNISANPEYETKEPAPALRGKGRTFEGKRGSSVPGSSAAVTASQR